MVVLPASSPSAVRKTSVILGPSLRILVTATQVPMTAATIGTIQTMESRVRFFGTALASATGGTGGFPSGMRQHLFRTGRIPDQPRIERLDAEHRQHDHRREEEQPRRR